ncbi:MAG: ketopantoate reductase family protein [Bacillota bacterium]|uniref:ketopantoate reductase family protein n=1 Tax=Virgibacillus sp. AGTR TaxID=2812055 RepID=UPI001963DABD|nr:2-dehydropantoate 2-reductase [Virgibacillus sp. AGTR]MCC2252012.1 2-dehydropantoate 2-reductase [Virgibacillus sp. AGTR]QRZ19593.1 2-dehydropantoate 2-reductase [Virgibacillus sp. AGTR]
MHIVVLGAGALGGYFGLRFQEAGAKVTFLVREQRAIQLKEQGAVIHSIHGDYETHDATIVTDPQQIEGPEVVLISVKGYHLQGAMKQLRVLVNKGAYILPVLNGIEHLAKLQNELGKASILGGLSFIIATLNDKGHVEHSSDFHELIYGALEPEQEAICSKLDKLSNSANMTGKNSNNILLELWKKYMFINAFSGVTAAVDLPIGMIRQHNETFHIMLHLLSEMKTLANIYDVPITEQDVKEAWDKLNNLHDQATSSMHQDRRKGLTLELDHLHGGALRLAGAKGIDLPYTRAVYGMLQPFENLT